MGVLERRHLGQPRGVAGFTDQTPNFTRNGTVFWTADPGGWAKRNVLPGNADNLPLFYVRVSLAAGSYTTSPVEGLIKTDILLLQYCGDVAVDFETFTIFAPVPTAVTLQSFEARAASGPRAPPPSSSPGPPPRSSRTWASTSTEGLSRTVPGRGSPPPSSPAWALRPPGRPTPGWTPPWRPARATSTCWRTSTRAARPPTRTGDATVGATDGGDDPPGQGTRIRRAGPRRPGMATPALRPSA